jgi:alpha-methylacyl-CoA racemase
LRARFATEFRTRTRDEWSRIFDGSDACFAPVLTFSEAATHPHAIARNAHVAVGNMTQPAPAPRFSRTPGAVRSAPPERGALGREALAAWGFTTEEIGGLAAQGLGFAT